MPSAFLCHIWDWVCQRGTSESFLERLTAFRDVLGPEHEALDGQFRRVLEKPRQVAFRDEPVPQRRPDHAYHRGRGLGPADGLGEEEVLHADDEGLGGS